MSELLSLDDYRGVAAELQIPDSAYIDGGYHRCGGDPLVTTNPADGAVLATIQMADDADVDMAVQRHAKHLTVARGRGCIRLNERRC